MAHKIALIGYGGMANWHHKTIKTIDELEIVGAYDINPEKVKKAEENGIKGFKTLEELLDDKSIEIVTIATPNNFHKDLAIAALKAGKNVVSEKPVMMNAAELEEVMKVAKETGKLFTVHQNRRWDEDYVTIKTAIENGEIGKPFYIESRVQGSRGIPGDWRCVKEAGGGMLLDWGVHLLDQIMWMVPSKVTEVYAQLLSIKFKDVDDNIKLMLKFENGTTAQIQVDTYTFINLPRWYVAGDHGTLQCNDWGCTGEVKKASTVEFKWEEGIVYTKAGPTRTMAPRPKETIETHPLNVIKTDIRDYYRNVCAAIEGKAELIVKPEEALRVMKVIDAAFESSEKGICVKGSF